MKPDTFSSVMHALFVAVALLAGGFYVSFVSGQHQRLEAQSERIRYLEFESDASREIASSMIDLLDLCLIERNDGLTPKP